MKNKSFLFMLFITVTAVGQQTQDTALSLQACIKMGLTNNLKLKQVSMETTKSQYLLKEAIGAGLPHVSSFVSFEDYLNVPTTMVSGEIIGQPGIMVPIQLGTKYNAVAGIQAGQLIYDASYFTSVKLFRKMAEISNMSTDQAKEELASAIAQMYIFIVISNSQLTLIDSSLVALKKIYSFSEQHFRNGLIRKTDLDRVTVIINTLSTDRDNLLTGRNQQFNMLKYMTGIEPNREVVLTDQIEEIGFESESADTTFRQLTMMKLLEGQKELAGINKSLAKAARVPSVSGYALFNYQGQIEDLKDLNNDNNWYKASYIGIKLTIPLFDANRITNRISQRKIEFEQAETSIEDLRKELKLRLICASEKLRVVREAEARSGFSKEMAAGIFKMTTQQYDQGLRTMTDVLSAQSDYNTAYMSWLNTLMQIKFSELEISKLNGTIKILFQ